MEVATTSRPKRRTSGAKPGPKPGKKRGRPPKGEASSNGVVRMYHILEVAGREETSGEGVNLFTKTRGTEFLVDRGEFPGKGPKAQETAVDAYLESTGQDEFQGFAIPSRSWNRQAVHLEAQPAKRVRAAD